MKTYLEIGVGISSEGRTYSYEPSGLEPGDLIITVDPTEDLGSRGISALSRNLNRPKIMPNSATARSYLLNGIADASEENSIRVQLESNQEYEHRCYRLGIKLIQLIGDGRDLALPDDSVDEILIWNLIGDNAISDNDALMILAESLRLVGSGNVILIENFTPWITRNRFARHASTLPVQVTQYDYDNGQYRSTGEVPLSITKDLSRINHSRRHLQGGMLFRIKGKNLI